MNAIPKREHNTVATELAGTRKSLTKEEALTQLEALKGTIMAGYTVTALSLDQQRNASHVIVAVSVIDSNGQPVHNLDGSNFTARDITTGAPIAIKELHHVGIRGFYQLSVHETKSRGHYTFFTPLRLCSHS